MSYFPVCWKSACVIPVFKNNVEPYEPLNYRLISLLTLFGNMLQVPINAKLFMYLIQMNSSRINNITPVSPGLLPMC